MNCLFCKIVAGEIPAKTVFSNDRILAFRDIGPKAPTHILVIPKKHIATLNDVKPEDAMLMGGLIQVATDVARAEKIDQSGYRLVVNCNNDGGQSVYHVHVHLMGGRQMAWPPG